LADKTQALILEGLARAAAEPEGKPLHAAKGAAGLFPSSAAWKKAAQACLDAGYLHVVGIETRGKATIDVYAITEAGASFLMSQVSPKQVLEQMVRVVDERGKQVEEVVAAARQCQATFESLKQHVARTLMQLQHKPVTLPAPTTDESWKVEALAFLAQWQDAKPHEDCPLPDLFAHARQTLPGLTLGQFHDGLRRLHDAGQVYLHPWTGPLYEIPDPACALLIGHAVAFYASRRSEVQSAP
jgi:hypothetical protein